MNEITNEIPHLTREASVDLESWIGTLGRNSSAFGTEVKTLKQAQAWVRRITPNWSSSSETWVTFPVFSYTGKFLGFGAAPFTTANLK